MKAYLALLFGLLFTVVSSAQVDRRIAPMQYKNGNGKAKPVDYVQQSVDYFKKELKLDDFQAAAIREIIEDEREGLDALMKDTESTIAERKDKMKIINERIDKKVLPLLSDDQQKKYKDLRKIKEQEEVELEPSLEKE
jgi:hypothetical protein